MKKITLATILLGTAVFLTPLQACDESILKTEEQHPSKVYLSPDATPEGMLFQNIARRIERYDGDSFGLYAATDGTPLYLLKVMNRPSFDLFASTQGDLKISTTRKIDDRGWVKIGQTYYAVREDGPQSDVPVVSSFMGRLRQSLPRESDFFLEEKISTQDMLAWACADYVRDFSKSKSTYKRLPGLILQVQNHLDIGAVHAYARTTQIFRDLLPTRANQFTPEVGVRLMAYMAKKYGAKVTTFREETMRTNFGMAYEVGKGSTQDRPNVTIMAWQPCGQDPLFTLDLVGKGVCFDTDGYNLKVPSEDQADMYADKGGALFQTLLATLIMENNLPIKLRVGNGWVVNVPGGTAQIQSDIYKLLSGITIENSDTDAEGRLVMGAILDYFRSLGGANVTMTAATLTGAALVAGGPNSGLMFVPKGDLKKDLMAGMRIAGDPILPMLVDPRHRKTLQEGTDADYKSYAGSFGGAATADAFLRLIAHPKTQFVHFDIASCDVGTPGFTPGVSKMDLFGLRGAYEGIVKYIARLQIERAQTSSSTS